MSVGGISEINQLLDQGEGWNRTAKYVFEQKSFIKFCLGYSQRIFDTKLLVWRKDLLR